MSASTCNPPRPGVDEDRAAERAVASELSEKRCVENPRVASVSGSSDDEHVGLRQQALEPVRRPKSTTCPGSDFGSWLQPATLKPSAQLVAPRPCPIRRARARRPRGLRALGCVVVVVPDALALLAFVAAQLARVNKTLHAQPIRSCARSDRDRRRARSADSADADRRRHDRRRRRARRSPEDWEAPRARQRDGASSAHSGRLRGRTSSSSVESMATAKALQRLATRAWGPSRNRDEQAHDVPRCVR